MVRSPEGERENTPVGQMRVSIPSKSRRDLKEESESVTSRRGLVPCVITAPDFAQLSSLLKVTTPSGSLYLILVALSGHCVLSESLHACPLGLTRYLPLLPCSIVCPRYVLIKPQVVLL